MSESCMLLFGVRPCWDMQRFCSLVSASPAEQPQVLGKGEMLQFCAAGLCRWVSGGEHSLAALQLPLKGQLSGGIAGQCARQRGACLSDCHISSACASRCDGLPVDYGFESMWGKYSHCLFYQEKVDKNNDFSAVLHIMAVTMHSPLLTQLWELHKQEHKS